MTQEEKLHKLGYLFSEELQEVLAKKLTALDICNLVRETKDEMELFHRRQCQAMLRKPTQRERLALLNAAGLEPDEVQQIAAGSQLTPTSMPLG